MDGNRCASWFVWYNPFHAVQMLSVVEFMNGIYEIAIATCYSDLRVRSIDPVHCMRYATTHKITATNECCTMSIDTEPLRTKSQLNICIWCSDTPHGLAPSSKNMGHWSPAQERRGYILATDRDCCMCRCTHDPSSTYVLSRTRSCRVQPQHLLCNSTMWHPVWYGKKHRRLVKLARDWDQHADRPSNGISISNYSKWKLNYLSIHQCRNANADQGWHTESGSKSS